MKGPRFQAFAVLLSTRVVVGLTLFAAGGSRGTAAEASNNEFTKQLGEALGKGIANAVKISELVGKATAANANDRPAEALALADEALKLDAGSEKALFERGRALRKLKRLEEAIAHFEKAVARYPKSVQLHYGLAMTYDDAQQPRQALGHYEALTKLAPKDPDWFAAYGATWYEVGEPERAMDEMRKALALDPKHPQAHSSLGFILMKLGRAAEAAAIYESWVRADPTNERAKARLAEARQREKNPAAAAASVAPAGATATSLAQQATAAFGKDDFASSLALAEQALQLDPDHEGALVEKGRALRGLGRMDEAIVFFEKAVARFPQSARLHNFLGGTYERAGQPAKAIAEQQIAARLDPKNVGYLTNQVSAYFTLGDLKGAEAVCQAALKINPKSAVAHGSLGAVYLKLDRLEDGIAEYETALQLRPDDKLAQAALDAARNLQRARRDRGAATVAVVPAAGVSLPVDAGSKIAVVAAPPASPAPRRSATPPGPDTTVRPKVERLGGEAVAALRGLPEVAVAGEKPRFVGAGEPKVIGQRAVANGATGVQVEWSGADAEGRPAVLRAEVLLDGAGRVAGARSTGMVSAESLELTKLLEGWR